MDKVAVERINIFEDFGMIDVMRKWHYSKEVLSDEKIDEAVRDLQKVFCCYERFIPVYVIKTYDAINGRYTVSYIKQRGAKGKLNLIIIGNVYRDNKLMKYTLWDLFIENRFKFTVKDLKFCSEEEDEQAFSYFRGYDYKELDEVKNEVIQPFLNHVREVIANDNEDVYKYIINWIASILQKPNFKNETALVILGDHGTGKNIFTNVICQLMARYANKSVWNTRSIVGKCNSVLENKKLVVLNEIQSVKKYLDSCPLKSIMTCKRITINETKEPERECDNVVNFILVSNDNVPRNTECINGWFLLTKTSDKYIGDFKYFDKLCDTFTQEFYENLFTFFMKLDVRDYDSHEIPNIEGKESGPMAFKVESICSTELFVREYYEEIKNISGPELFNMYCDFVEKNKFNSCTSRTFISNIKQFTGEAKVKRIDGKNRKVYDLLPEYYEKIKKIDEFHD